MKKMILILSVALLGACSSSTDNEFCTCLTAGEAFNERTQEFMDKAPTAEEAEELTKLKEEKESACVNYETMGGDEMRALKEACEAE